MKLRSSALAATAALLLLAPAAAQARTGPPLQPFPYPETVAYPAPVSDGARHFVINVRPGTIRVYDTQAKRAHDLAVGDECVAQDGTPGVVLVTCEEDASALYDRPHLLRLRDRSLTPLLGPRASSPVERWSAIGRHWLRGAVSGMGKQSAVYLNWRTGERRSDSDDFHGSGHFDIDDPKLRPYPAGVFERDGSLALRGSRLGAEELWLVRPGHDARLSANQPSDIQLSAGLVTWTESPVVARAYDARSRVRYGWDAGPGSSATVAHTRKHVLVGVREEQTGAPRLMWARVRR